MLNTVPVRASGTAFAAGIPVRLFKAASITSFSYSDRFYDVSPDGQRFLMIKEDSAADRSAPVGIVVVVNWQEELKAKLPR